MPKMEHVKAFFVALLLPGWSLMKAMNGLAKWQERAMLQATRVLIAIAAQLSFFGFVICHILTPIYKDNDIGITGQGLWMFGWACYLSKVLLTSMVRHLIRRHYSIEGSGMEDFWAALLFYPQVLAQMVAQIPTAPAPKKAKARPKLPDGRVRVRH